MRPVRAATLLAFLCAAEAAQADIQIPSQAQICDPKTHVIDRDKLTTYLLDQLLVSRQVEDWASAHQGRFNDITLRQRLLVDEDVCAKDPTAADHCAATDKDNLKQLGFVVASILDSQSQSYRAPYKNLEPHDFFAHAVPVVCVQDGSQAPVEMAGAVVKKFDLRVPVRVRGSPDGLYISRNDKTLFAAEPKAAISFSDDQVAGKRSEKFAVYAGYPIKLLAHDDKVHSTVEMIPFAGIARDLAQVSGKPETVNTKLWRAGIAFDGTITAGGMTHFLVARPEYVANTKEHSRLFGMNLTYLPVINNALNDYLFARDSSPVAVRPILDLRLNNGHFFASGDRAPEDSHDYSRIGTQFGAAFSSNDRNYPVDLTVTYTYLHALTGNPANLHYFKTLLSLGLTKDKTFGIDVSYEDGRIEDLVSRSKDWTIGFGAKF